MNKEEILAMEAGEKLDHLVMKEIFEASMKYYGEDEIWYHYDSSGEPDYEWSCYNSPSTNISAAWEVAEKFQTYQVTKTHQVSLPSGPEDMYRAIVNANKFVAYAKTAPLAICRAALLAVME